MRCHCPNDYHLRTTTLRNNLISITTALIQLLCLSCSILSDQRVHSWNRFSCWTQSTSVQEHSSIPETSTQSLAPQPPLHKITNRLQPHSLTKATIHRKPFTYSTISLCITTELQKPHLNSARRGRRNEVEPPYSMTKSQKFLLRPLQLKHSKLNQKQNKTTKNPKNLVTSVQPSPRQSQWDIVPICLQFYKRPRHKTDSSREADLRPSLCLIQEHPYLLIQKQPLTEQTD